MKKWGAYLFLIILWNHSRAQLNLTNNFQTFTNPINSFPSDSLQFFITESLLLELKENPINLNDTSFSNIDRLFFLTPSQLESLKSFLKSYHPLKSLYELRSLYWMNPDLLTKINKTVVLGDHVSNSKFWRYKLKGSLKSRTSNILEKQNGFIKDSTGTSTFMGSREKSFLQVDLNLGNRLFLYANFQKQPGEKYFLKRTPEYLSAYIAYKGSGCLKEIFLGKFRIDWSPYLRSSNHFYSEVFNLSPYTKVKGYRSTIDFNSLQGISSSFSLKNFSWSNFISFKKNEFKLNSHNDTSINFLGYHRTENEISQIIKVPELILGTSFRYKTSFWAINGSHIYHSSNNNLLSTSFIAYLKKSKIKLILNTLNFQGYNTLFTGDFPFKNGDHISIHIEKNNRQFNSLEGIRLGDKDRIKTKSGYQIYWKKSLSKNAQLGIGIINKQFFYKYDSPYSYQSLITELETSFWREERTKYTVGVVNNNHMYFRILKTIKVNNFIRIKLNLKVKTRELNHEWEPLSYLGLVNFKLNNSKSTIQFNTTFAIFNTASYYSRFIINDFSIPQFIGFKSLYDKGSFASFGLNYKIKKSAKISFKIDRISFDLKRTNGSGLNEIKGPHKTEFVIQFLQKF